MFGYYEEQRQNSKFKDANNFSLVNNFYLSYENI